MIATYVIVTIATTCMCSYTIKEFCEILCSYFEA